MDSAAIAYQLKPDICLTVDYGQRPAEGEVVAAKAISDAIGLKHELLRVDIGAIGGGLLFGEAVDISRAPTPEWLPYRNQLLVTLAGMRFLRAGIEEIIIGTVKGDSVHSDGQPDFIRKISLLMEAQEGAVKVTAPALNISGEELIRNSKIPRSILAYSLSCHRSSLACGNCRGCFKAQSIWAKMEEGER